MLACATSGPPGPDGPDRPDGPKQEKKEPDGPLIPEGPGGFQPDQPEFPVPEDDPFFLAPAAEDVAFRILVTEGNYQVRQMRHKETLRRKRDANGDRDQVRVFRRFSDRYNFHDIDFRGLIVIRLNPHSGDIEMVKFVPGETPRAWQATTFIKDDASRLAFAFPKERVAVREFQVEYLWRIRRPPGMTDEEARRRAIEFLKRERD